MSDSINILDLLHAPRRHDALVGWRGESALTHAAFLTRARQWHALLAGAAGNRIALFFNDSIEFAAALFGAWHAAKTVYLPSDTLPATCASLHTLTDCLVGDFPADCMTLRGPAADAPASNGLGKLEADFPGLVVFTSGSTGVPQAIPKKLGQLAAETATLEQLFGKDVGPAAVVATVSHQHIYGLLFKVLWPLACGRPIHASSLVYPEQLAQATAARDCLLVSSPAHLKRLPDSAAWAANTHRVCAVFSSGGPLPREVADVTARLLGHAPFEVYGSSETGGIAWRQRVAGTGEDWRLLPGVAARVAADGETLEIRSPHLPDDAWFRTADRAQILDPQRLLLHGRADRIVKIEEKRVSLDLIETRLKNSPLVSEARVIMASDRRQRIAAFIVLSGEGSALLASEGKLALNQRLRNWLADMVEPIALPRQWRYLDALPVNAQGKTTQAELSALLDQRPAAGAMELPHLQLIEKEAQRAVFGMRAPRELTCFQGHFPQTPILPGVAQVEWAVQLSRQCFDLPGTFRAMHALKFQQVIAPETSFMLELLHDPAKNSVAFRYFSAGTAGSPHSSGRLMFGASNV